MQALTHALTDKVEYCKQYGFDIEYEDWPVTGLPDAILADKYAFTKNFMMLVLH
jgi:hypothetical protein